MRLAAIIFSRMPRKNPVPERELAVCRRLREFRLHTKLSQVAFAKEVDLDSARLASYEHGRAPIRYRLALLAHAKFELNLEWLAEGVGSFKSDGELPKVAHDCNHWDLFTDVYFQELKPALEAKRASARAVAKTFQELLDESPSSAHGYLYLMKILLAGVMAKSPPSVHPDLFGAVSDCVQKYWKENVESKGLILAYSGKDIATGMLELLRWGAKDEAEVSGGNLSNAQIVFDQDDKAMLNSPVAKLRSILPRSWDQLKTRLVPVTDPQGAKATLANDLRVSLAAVSQWRSGSARPDADKTLQLLNWVLNAEEAKQKSSGAGATEPEQKTQLKGSSDETKPKSGRRKK